jgi:hypothetical protein
MFHGRRHTAEPLHGTKTDIQVEHLA